VDPNLKDFQIRFGYRLQSVLDEVLKCVLACSNCHGEIHDGLIASEKIEAASLDVQRMYLRLLNKKWADFQLGYAESSPSLV
jgi:hypothetical protein